MFRDYPGFFQRDYGSCGQWRSQEMLSKGAMGDKNDSITA